MPLNSVLKNDQNNKYHVICVYSTTIFKKIPWSPHRLKYKRKPCPYIKGRELVVSPLTKMSAMDTWHRYFMWVRIWCDVIYVSLAGKFDQVPEYGMFCRTTGLNSSKDSLSLRKYWYWCFYPRETTLGKPNVMLELWLDLIWKKRSYKGNLRTNKGNLSDGQNVGL